MKKVVLLNMYTKHFKRCATGNRDHYNYTVILNIFWGKKYWWQVCQAPDWAKSFWLFWFTHFCTSINCSSNSYLCVSSNDCNHRCRDLLLHLLCGVTLTLWTLASLHVGCTAYPERSAITYQYQYRFFGSVNSSTTFHLLTIYIAH